MNDLKVELEELADQEREREATWRWSYSWILRFSWAALVLNFLCVAQNIIERRYIAAAASTMVVGVISVSLRLLHKMKPRR